MRYVSYRLSAAHADLYFRFRNILGGNSETDLTALACPQMDPLETPKIAYRGITSGAAADIQLDHFVAVHGRSVLDRHANLGAFRGPFRGNVQILKGGIAQPKTERVKSFAFEIAVSTASHSI